MVDHMNAGLLKLVIVEGEITFDSVEQLDLFVSLETPH